MLADRYYGIERCSGYTRRSAAGRSREEGGLCIQAQLSDGNKHDKGPVFDALTMLVTQDSYFGTAEPTRFWQFRGSAKLSVRVV